MAFEKHVEKDYPRSAHDIYSAARKAVETLEGRLAADSAADYRFEAVFKKTILGKTLGERTRLSCSVVPQGHASRVVIDAYPLDALERKLMFGARKGVTQTVLSWFVSHLEHHLGGERAETDG